MSDANPPPNVYRAGVRIVRAALAAFLLVTAVPVAAHQGDPWVYTVVDEITPPLPGVTVEVRVGVADQLLVVNPSNDPVEVLDAGGRPFLRIGPDVVEADTGNPSWHTSNSPLGLARVPAGTAPRWRVVAKGDSWGWFDHRLHDRAFGLPANDAVNARLADWTVPLRHAGLEHLVRGHVEYRPSLGTFRARYAALPPDTNLDVFDGKVPGLFLGYAGEGTMTVYGIDGAPFARLGPARTEVNEASATWQDDQRLRGNVPMLPADPAKPHWRSLGRDQPVVWLDRRLAYAPGLPPPDVLRSRRVTTMVEWDIRADVNGVTHYIQGVTEWLPARRGDGNGLSRWYGLAASAAGVLIGTLLVHLRRRAKRDSPIPR